MRHMCKVFWLEAGEASAVFDFESKARLYPKNYIVTTLPGVNTCSAIHLSNISTFLPTMMSIR